MPSYAESTDVGLLLARWGVTIGSEGSDKKTVAEVEAEIAQAEADINGVLRAQDYPTVPATGDDDVNMLKKYVARKTAAELWMEIASSGDLPGVVKEWLEAFDNFLMRLRRGQQYLINQSPRGQMDPAFLIVRHPTRDDTFTDKSYDSADWDE